MKGPHILEKLKRKLELGMELGIVKRNGLYTRTNIPSSKTGTWLMLQSHGTLKSQGPVKGRQCSAVTTSQGLGIRRCLPIVTLSPLARVFNIAYVHVPPP